MQGIRLELLMMNIQRVILIKGRHGNLLIFVITTIMTNMC